MIVWAGNQFNRRAVTDLNTEAAPADGDFSAGVELAGLKYITCHVESATPFPVNAVLAIYVMNPTSQKWNQIPDIPYTLTPGLTRQAFPAIDVSNRVGRFALIPVGAVPMTIDYFGTRMT